MRLEGFRSIRGALLWRLGIVFAAGMGALYLAATSYAKFAADSSFDQLLTGSAGSIAETLSITPSEVRVDIPYAALDMLAAAPDDRVFYRVIGVDGKTVTGYSDLPFDTAATRRGGATGSASFFDARYRGEAVRFVTLGREVRVGGRSGWVWVQVGQTRAARSQLARQLTIRALLPIVAMTVLAGAVVWASVGRAMRPLEKVGQDLAARNAADLSPIATNVPREVETLIAAVNQFMGRLDKNMNVLRTFIADAAHQLRTPLAALLVQIRAAETNVGPARKDSLAAAGLSAKRLARLVDQLLSDAVVAHRAEARHTAPFDLKKVIEHSLHDVLPLVGDADVRFTTELPEAVMLGDEVMVAEAVKNLLHNALVHGAADDRREQVVEVLLRRVGPTLELSVSDSGHGMAAEAIDAAGRRFNTGNPAGGGVGLGLAIVRQVAESHGGSLRVENRAGGGGLRVTLEFAAA